MEKNIRKARQARKNGGGSKTAPNETRSQKVATKEEAIITAAMKMFVAKGFAKTTMSGIAKDAGVAEGTLYLYFTNKEDLARGVLAAFYERLTVSAGKGIAKASTTKQRLTFLAKHHLENIIREKRLLELLMVLDRDLSTYDGGEIYKMNRTYVAVFDSVIREGVWRGDIEKSYTHWVLRDIFFGSLEHAMRTMLIKGRENEIDRYVKELVKMMLGSFASSTASRAKNDLSSLTKRLENTADRLDALIEVGSSGKEEKS